MFFKYYYRNKTIKKSKNTIYKYKLYIKTKIAAKTLWSKNNRVFIIQKQYNLSN